MTDPELPTFEYDTLAMAPEDLAGELGEEDFHVDYDPDAPFAAPESSCNVARYRIAAALDRLRGQVNAKAPGRSKRSDGWIGDKAHCARESDHNPHVMDGTTGVVTALDVTHDTAGGCDAGAIAAALVNARDRRIKYVIWNRKIASSSPVGGKPAWTWRPYGGSNPHDKHVHVSVLGSKSAYDDKAAWAI